MRKHPIWSTGTSRPKPGKVLGVADITYVPTHAGFLYLSVVIDAFSRRVALWSMANHLRSELVSDAMDMALCQRRPDEVIHHSNQGSQYTLSGLRQATQAGRRQTLHGFGRRLLRQRPVKRASSPAWSANCLIVGDLPRG